MCYRSQERSILKCDLFEFTDLFLALWVFLAASGLFSVCVEQGLLWLWCAGFQETEGGRTHFEMRLEGFQLPLHLLLRLSGSWLGGKQAATLGRGAVTRPAVRSPGPGESGAVTRSQVVRCCRLGAGPSRPPGTFRGFRSGVGQTDAILPCS